MSGGTASGKTTVCDMIIQQLHDHRIVLVNQVKWSGDDIEKLLLLFFGIFVYVFRICG